MPSAACSPRPTPHHEPDQLEPPPHQARPEQPPWESWTGQRYPHPCGQHNTRRNPKTITSKPAGGSRLSVRNLASALPLVSVPASRDAWRMTGITSSASCQPADSSRRVLETTVGGVLREAAERAAGTVAVVEGMAILVCAGGGTSPICSKPRNGPPMRCWAGSSPASGSRSGPPTSRSG